MALILYCYYRSSASYRVRIALNLKDLHYELRPVNLLKNGGEHHRPEYKALNPQGLVPVLMDENTVLSQSTSIIEYLEEVYPTPALLPDNSIDRAYVRSIVQIIACDIHPLNNLRVLSYLKQVIHYDDLERTWYKHWIHEGFAALETMLEKHSCNGLYCYGNKPSMADIFLIPQVYNAMRFDCQLETYPLISRIYQNSLLLPAFSRAAPKNQVDAQ